MIDVYIYILGFYGVWLIYLYKNLVYKPTNITVAPANVECVSELSTAWRWAKVLRLSSLEPGVAGPSW